MFWNAKNNYRVDRMERCCEKLTSIVEGLAPLEQKMADDTASLHKDIKLLKDALDEHYVKEDSKNKWIYDQFEVLKTADVNIDKKITSNHNKVMNKVYLVFGGAAVVIFLLKFTDFSIKLTQG